MVSKTALRQFGKTIGTAVAKQQLRVITVREGSDVAHESHYTQLPPTPNCTMIVGSSQPAASSWTPDVRLGTAPITCN